MNALQAFLSSYIPFSSIDDSIKFVKAGSKSSTRAKVVTGIFHKADDWKLSFDSVDKALVIPPYLAISPLRPDVLLSQWHQRGW